MEWSIDVDTVAAMRQPGPSEEQTRSADTLSQGAEGSASHGDGGIVPTQEAENDNAAAPYFSLYRFATFRERIILFVATLAAGIHGAAWPVWALLFGQTISKFDPNNVGNIVDGVRSLALDFVYVGIVIGISASIHIYIFSTMGSRLAARIRYEYLRAVLRQEIAWHDVNPSAKLDTMLAVNSAKIQAGMSNKVGEFIQTFSQIFVGVGIGLYYSWKLALVFLGFSPILMVCMGSFNTVLGSFQKRQNAIYETAGVVVAEILALMRTVMAFGTYDRETDRFTKQLAVTYEQGL
jgi:ATP-binding cassette subfamily B (MDR/TAP) protein 1